MSYRPLTEEEKKHYEGEIKRLQGEINLKEQVIEGYREKIKEGNWVSDIDWSKK